MNIVYPFLRAPVFEDEDTNRVAALLHIILVSLTPINLLTLLADIVLTRSATPSLPSHLFTLLMMITLFIPFYLGKIRLTSVILCTATWIIFAYTAYHEGGIFNPIFGANTLIIFVSGLLINGWAALVVAGCSSLYGIWLLRAAEAGNYILQVETLTVRDAWINNTAVFLVAAFFLFLSLRAIREAQTRAQSNARALHKSEERYRSLLFNAPDLIYVVDANHEIGFANYGLNDNLSNIIGRKIHDFVLNDSAEAFKAALNQVFTIGSADPLEIHGKKSGGQIAWFLIHLAPIWEEKQVIEVVVIMTDISDRKRMELELRASAKQYRQLFEHNPHPMFVADWETLKILEVNDAIMAQYGYTREEFLNMTIKDIGAEEDIPVVVRRVEKYRAANTQYDSGIVWRHRRKDGSIIWMEASFHSLKFAGREASLVANYDLTERRRAEEANLEAQKLRLELTKQKEVLALKENFIAMMSHEFRTPLSIILSSKESLEHYSDRLTPERRLDKLHQIGDQVRYVIRLLDDVLMMGKAYAGKLQFNPAPLNLVEFCRRLFEEIQITDKLVHRFVFQIEQELGIVDADKQLLQHIIVNLLSNAIKYAPAETEIRMEVGLEDEKAFIRMSDQGIGMSKENQAHLYEPFYRADNAKAYEGTGLGLAIVKESVELHGGTITCESDEGKGTTFIVRLPLRVTDKAD